MDKLMKCLESSKPENDDFSYPYDEPDFPLEVSHNCIGPIHFNKTCKIATILERNGNYINIRCVSLRNKTLHILNDEVDHFDSKMSDCGKYVAFTRSKCGLEELCLYSIPDKKISVISRNEGGYGSFRFSEDSEILEYIFSSINERGNVYRYEIQKGKLTAITNYKNPMCFLPPEIIKLGGFSALIYKPDGFVDTKKYPVVIQISSAHEPPTASWSGLEVGFHLNGIVLIKPCINGKMGCGAENLYSIEGKCGSLDVLNIVAITENIKKLHFIENNSITLVGSSFGGFIALRTIQENDSLFKGLILIGAVYDLEDFALSRTESWDYLPYSFYFGKLEKVKSSLASISPMNFIEKIKIPILIFHGKRDPRVDIIQAKKFIEEGSKAGLTITYSDDLNTHGNNSAAHLYKCNVQMVEYIKSLG